MKELKQFFENEEVSKYNFDLFDKTKKKMEQFEGILSEIRLEMQNKDKRKLPGLVNRAEKLGIHDNILDEARKLYS